MTQMLYLRPNVQVSPLIANWYAWPYLIPPACAARNITERHIPIMKSYVRDPRMHAEAVRNPQMVGGPFIDAGTHGVDDVAALLKQTSRDLPQLLELSYAISELDTMLRTDARGLSLKPLYSKVPLPLRGYVELVYDLNHHPSFRIIEGLMYRSKYYDRRIQTLLLSTVTQDERPFILSTPHLADGESVELRVPFDHPSVDWLFQLKSQPQSWNQILNQIEVRDSQLGLLRSMFTTQSPPRYRHYDGPGLRWRYFGHACVLIEAPGVSILVDPVLSYKYETAIPRYTYEDLPEKIDYVLITHNHQDHVSLETLLQIRHKVSTFVVPDTNGGALQDPSLKSILENTGFRNVVGLKQIESIQFAQGSITGLPFFGEHADLDVQSKLGYLVRIGRHSLLFLADSCNLEPLLYTHLSHEVGDVTAAFVGMECDGAPLTWLYGPLMTRRIDRSMDMSRRLAGSNYEQAINMIEQFNPKETYVYAMGQEPWLNYIMSVKYTTESRPIVESNRLIAECTARGMVAARLFGEKEILLQD